MTSPTMISEGFIAAWAATARAVAILEPAETELVPDIAQSAAEQWGRIRRVPGAFDFDLVGVQSMAITLFPIVLAAMSSAMPKLFDASIDVGKEVVKKLVERRLAAKTASPTSPPIDAAHLHETIRVAVIERRLSPTTADAIANAVVTQLAIEKSV
ncbi:hypothetical protein [Niveibacterium sp. COAC-50]|uniref:hypothetical protein n=1 Tax=Niveibacterium sp. COAC-50 TaxID=2729384 RepID=UPI001555806F|nr:hypothetical protein [Niveibacterium sp. COAC-50]